MPDSTLPSSLWEALRQLAYGDRERAGILSAIAHAKVAVEHDERLDRARARHDTAQRTLGELQSRRRELEATVEDAKAKKLRTEARLASGRLQAEREIEAAQHEIVTLDRLIVESEDAWVDTSDREESAQAVLVKQRAALKSEEHDAQVRRSKAEREVRDAEERLATVDASRRAAARQLPAALRDRYRALFSATGGHPFATVDGGECSHCHRSVPGDAMQMLRLGTGVPSCPSCSRLLLLP